MSIHWLTGFQVTQRLSAFACPGTIAEQSEETSAYHWEGAQRRETHCLFQYTFEGFGIFRDRGGEHRIGSGRGFLCRINDPETAYYYPEKSRHTWRFLYFTFTNADGPVTELVQRFGPVYSLATDATPILRLRSYRDTPGTRLSISPGEGSHLVHSLLNSLADSVSSCHRKSASAWLVRKAKQTIHAHLEENFNISDLAAAVGVSHEHLSRIFRKETGITPQQYLKEEKTRRTCVLLRNSNLSCKEICYRMGYDSPSHFARSFRNVMGVTPGKYRKLRAYPLL